MPKISSATIRNELNALEEMGYLTHLHTSSGRVPTKEGYEFKGWYTSDDKEYDFDKEFNAFRKNYGL